MGQSFFDPLPSGGDFYLLKNVLADWPDREAMAILKRCADAARPTGRVIVLGGVSGEEGRPPSPELLMLVLVGESRGAWRSFATWRTGLGWKWLRPGGSLRGDSSSSAGRAKAREAALVIRSSA